MPKTRRLSDASLVRGSQQGDRRAFGALVGRYDARLRGLAYALLLNPAAMDATLASAYLRAWRDVVRLTAKDDAGAWLYRVTYNACIDALRRDGEPPAPGGRGMRAGLAKLPPADRVAVVLVDREGFTPEAAARILGLPPADIDARLDAARETLAPYLPPPVPTSKPEATLAQEPESESEPDPELAAQATRADPEPAAPTAEPAAPTAEPAAPTAAADASAPEPPAHPEMKPAPEPAAEPAPAPAAQPEAAPTPAPAAETTPAPTPEPASEASPAHMAGAPTKPRRTTRARKKPASQPTTPPVAEATPEPEATAPPTTEPAPTPEPMADAPAADAAPEPEAGAAEAASVAAESHDGSRQNGDADGNGNGAEPSITPRGRRGRGKGRRRATPPAHARTAEATEHQPDPAPPDGDGASEPVSETEAS